MTRYRLIPPDIELTETLQRLKKQQPLIDVVFYLDKDQRIELPLSKLLYLPDGSSGSLIQQVVPASLAVGQDYEFQQKLWKEALASAVSSSHVT